jgi:L-alanine-DL-glutamate epimerase-like enolase superfamily enzyme
MRKFKSVSFKEVKIKRQKAFKISTATHTEIYNIQINLVCEENITGIGVIAPDFSNKEDIKEIKKQIKFIKEYLLNYPFESIQRFIEILALKKSFYNSVLAGFDIALHDLMAKKANVSLTNFLQLEYRPKVDFKNENMIKSIKHRFDKSDLINFKQKWDLTRSFFTISIDSLDNSLEEIEARKLQGFNKFKIKIGEDLANDKVRIIRIRERNPETILIADANQAYDINQAIEIANVLKVNDYLLFEQPVKKASLGDLRTVKENSKIPILADESFKNYEDLEKLLENKVVDGFVFKIMKNGGIYQTSKLIKRALESNVNQMILSCMSENSISISAAFSLSKAFPEIQNLDLDSALMGVEDPYQIFDKSWFKKNS